MRPKYARAMLHVALHAGHGSHGDLAGFIRRSIYVCIYIYTVRGEALLAALVWLAGAAARSGEGLRTERIIHGRAKVVTFHPQL